jgi:hypothetical protein
MPLINAILAILLGVVPVLAQDVTVAPLAAVHDEDVWLYGFDAEPYRITDGTANNYSHLVWSPDGSFLAFVALDEDFRGSLWLYERSSNALNLVEEEIPAGLPINFSGDSRELLFFIDSTPPGSGPGNPMDVYSYDVTGHTSRMRIATVELGEGCGGGSSFAGDWRYWNETEGLGGFYAVLELTAFGLVYSKDCGYSTALLNLDTPSSMRCRRRSRRSCTGARTSVRT